MKAIPVLLLGGQGYVGSALAVHLQRAGVPVRSVDLGLRGTPGRPFNECRPYQSLTADELAAFGSVVLLAGHSSVGACEQSPEEAFANNVAGFVDLVHKLRGQKLLFASSISVYVSTHGRAASESEPLPEPVCYYDLHKQLIERYATLAYPNSYALRFGTVCGPSPNLRPELLLNSLVRSARRNGCVQVANRPVSRPLLGIGDLCRAVQAILTGAVPPGCYNLASFNATIGAVADYVAGYFGANCQEITAETKYDIRVDTGKLRQASGLEFQDDLPGLVAALERSHAFLPEPRSLCYGL
jgi:nucleoside-diphosphate-sugar epimerase